MKRLLRFAKRVPGFMRLRHAVLEFLRRNTLVRALAKRILPVRGQVTYRAPRLTAGRAFDPDRAAALPIVLIVAVGLDESGANELVRRVEQAQRLTGGFVPVFVVDTGAFGPFRTHGYALEHMLDAASWGRFSDPVDWTDYRLERIGMLWRDYGASQVTLVENDHIPSVQTLTLLASQPAPPVPLVEPAGVPDPSTRQNHPATNTALEQ